jgi:hypothetical protein
MKGEGERERFEFADMVLIKLASSCQQPTQILRDRVVCPNAFSWTTDGPATKDSEAIETVRDNPPLGPTSAHSAT